MPLVLICTSGLIVTKDQAELNNLGPIWQARGVLNGLRPDFQSEVARILDLKTNELPSQSVTKD